MAKHEIKTRLSMEGEQQYRSAMKEAANSIKVLDSELKLAESQFKKTGDAQEYLTKKAEILQKEIAAQKEAVAAAEKALADMAANGVDKNDRKYQQWETTLNNAKTKLNNLETAAKTTSEQIKKQGESAGDAVKPTEEFGEAAGDAADAGSKFKEALAGLGINLSLQGVIDAIDSVEQKLISGIKRASEFAKELWDLGTASGNWADTVATEASRLGVDVETYQQMQHASKIVDTDVSAIAKEYTRIVQDQNSWAAEIQKSISDHEKDSKKDVHYIADAEQKMNDLGIATREAGANYKAANPEFRSAEEIFWDIIDVLHNTTNEVDRNRLAVELLGKQWQQFNPIIEAGSEAYKEQMEWAKENATVSQEQVEALGKLNDAQMQLESRWDSLQNSFWANLAPALTEVANLLGDATGKLQEFLNSAEGQEAMSALNDALSGLVKSLAGELNGDTFANILDKAKKAIEGLTSALEWAGNNGDTIVNTLKGVAAAIAGMEVAKDVLKFLQMINNVKTLANLNAYKQMVAGGGGGGGDTPVVPDVPATPSVPSAQPKTSWFKNALKTAGTALTSAVGAEALFVAGGVGIAAGISAIQDAANKANYKKNVELTEEFGTANENAAGKVSALATAMETLNQALTSGDLQTAIQLMSQLDTEAMLKEMPSLADTSAFETWDRVGGIENWLTSGEPVGQQAEAFMNELVTAISTFMAEQQETLKDSAKQVGLDVDAGMAEGIGEGTDPVTIAAGDLGETSIDKLKETTGSHSPSTITHQIGLDMDTGLANGIAAGQSLVVVAATKVAQAAVDKIKATLKIHSPSKVAEGLGGYFDAGFVNGLLDGRQRVQAAVNDVLSIAGNTPAPAYAYRGAAPRASAGAAPVVAGGEGAMNATIVMDKQIVGQMVAPIVNAQIGAMIKQRR